MFTLEQRVGRLTEVRYGDTLTVDEFTHLMAKTRALVTEAPRPLVFVTDARHVSTFPKDVEQSLVWVMRRDNPKVVAGGILLSPTNVVFQRQAERIVREANGGARRTFFDPKVLANWLGMKLDPKERARLDAFLKEEWEP